MKCITCQTDIPPAWVACIQANSCPGCGGQIMDQSAQELLSELKEAMEKMPNDPAGLAGWLLSHYTLRKIGTAEPTQFYNKAVKKKSDYDDSKIKINENNPVQKFLQRAGMKPQAQKQNNLKSIAEMINKGELDDDVLYGENEEVDEDIDMEDAAEYFDQDETFAKQAFNNQLVVAQPGKKPITQAEVAKIMEVIGELDGGAGDGAKALQESRMDRLKKQREMASGIGGGSFRRGS